MYTIYNEIIHWSEVWSLIIPLIIYIFRPANPYKIQPVIWFIVIALVCAVFATFISQIGQNLPRQYRNNGIAYNLVAIVKVLILGRFLIRQPQMQKFRYLHYLILFYIVLGISIFAFGASPFDLNRYLLAATSIVMLAICLTFFLNTILDDEYNPSESNWLFLICTGIAVYEVINFFIYLFLFELYMTNEPFSRATSVIFEYSHIISNAFVLLGIYKACYPPTEKAIRNLNYQLNDK